MNEDVSPRKKLGDFPSSNRHVSFPWILRVFETPHPGLLIFHPVNQAPRHPLEGAGIHINSPNQYIYIYTLEVVATILKWWFTFLDDKPLYT